MRVFHLFGYLIAVAAFTLAGCSETTLSDVESARDNVQEERQETENTRQDVAENLRSENAETAEAERRAASKPVISDEVMEEQNETQEARQEGAEAIAEEERETRDAEAELERTRLEFAATQARNSFVIRIEERIEFAKERINTLEVQASNQEGDVKEVAESKVEGLKTQLTQVNDQLDELKGAELMQWEKHRESVERSLNQLITNLDNA